MNLDTARWVGRGGPRAGTKEAKEGYNLYRDLDTNNDVSPKTLEDLDVDDEGHIAYETESATEGYYVSATFRDSNIVVELSTVVEQSEIDNAVATLRKLAKDAAANLSEQAQSPLPVILLKFNKITGKE